MNGQNKTLRPLTLCRVPKARICITCLCFSLFLHVCLNQPSAFSAILFILTSAVISYPDLLTHFALAAILNTFPSSLEILVTWFCCVPGSFPEPPPYWKARRPWGRGCAVTSPNNILLGGGEGRWMPNIQCLYRVSCTCRRQRLVFFEGSKIFLSSKLVST